ncbi:hypothetical protein [Nocardioides litoris]|uniref:hypothetical protein n=1 Tax=Nocardioides litoris TaxID=1926648 RepID=UPI0011219098|nr:hypothetical protein [Nocardioides litoris]
MNQPPVALPHVVERGQPYPTSVVGAVVGCLQAIALSPVLALFAAYFWPLLPVCLIAWGGAFWMVRWATGGAGWAVILTVVVPVVLALTTWEAIL